MNSSCDLEVFFFVSLLEAGAILTDTPLASNVGHLAKCMTCGSACCRYITVEIPCPRSMLDYDNLIWQLSHKNIRAFKDGEGWYLLVSNECVHLSGNGTCSIYDQRPFACREYSVNACDFDFPVRNGAPYFFADAPELDAFCRSKFKNWDNRRMLKTKSS